MISLLPYNTLQVDAQADELLEINNVLDIKKVDIQNPILFLGEGANVLFIKDFPGTVAKVNLKGKNIVSENTDSVTIEIAAGEDWHSLVMWSVDQGWSGMENMAYIPGSVGAAAVGNIAAYGQNQEDIFVKLRATYLKSQKSEEFAKADCQFGYRESAFKHTLKDYLVTSVTYQLLKTSHFDTTYHSRYESLAAELPPQDIYTPTDIAEAVVRLRTKKLPDWHKVGTAGSFFKNPVVSKVKYLALKSQVPSLQAYPPTKLQYQDESGWLDQVTSVKVPAGRLLDELGWKGKHIGNVGTHTTHALTIVNYGGATGQEIYDFAESMREDIKTHYQIDLEYEVQIV